MAIARKAKIKRRVKKAPPAGRKMAKQEARDYVFKTYRQAMELLAKH
jgi:hypothetical protein